MRRRTARRAAPEIGQAVALVDPQAQRAVKECTAAVAEAVALVKASDPVLSAQGEKVIEWSRREGAPVFDASDNLLGPGSVSGDEVWHRCRAQWEDNRDTTIIRGTGNVHPCDVPRQGSDALSHLVLESWLAATDASNQQGPVMRGPINQKAAPGVPPPQHWRGASDARRLLDVVDGQYARRAGEQGHIGIDVPEAEPVSQQGRRRRLRPPRASSVPMAAPVRGGAVQDQAPDAAVPALDVGSGLVACYNRLRAIGYSYRMGIETLLSRDSALQITRTRVARQPFAAEAVWRQLHRVRYMREVREKRAAIKGEIELLRDEITILANRARAENTKKVRLRAHANWVKCRARGVNPLQCDVTREQALIQARRAAAGLNSVATGKRLEIGQKERELRKLGAASRRDLTFELGIPGRALPDNAIVPLHPDDIARARVDVEEAERFAAYGWDSPVTVRVLDAYRRMKEVEYYASVVGKLMRALGLPIPSPTDCFACAPGTSGPCLNNETRRCGQKTWKNGRCRGAMVPCNKYGAAPRDPSVADYNPITGQLETELPYVGQWWGNAPARPGFVSSRDLPRVPSRPVSRRRSARPASGTRRGSPRRAPPGSAPASARVPKRAAPSARRVTSTRRRVRSRPDTVPVRRRPQAQNRRAASLRSNRRPGRATATRRSPLARPGSRALVVKRVSPKRASSKASSRSSVIELGSDGAFDVGTPS